MINTEETFPGIREIPSPAELRPATELLRVALPHVFFGTILVALFSFTLLFLFPVIMPAWFIGGCVPLGVWAAWGPGDYFKRIAVGYVLSVIMWMPAIFFYVTLSNNDFDLWRILTTTFLFSLIAFFASQAIPVLLRWFANWHLVAVVPTANRLEDGSTKVLLVESEEDHLDSNQFTIVFLLKITMLVAILSAFFRVYLEIDPSRVHEILIFILVPIVAQAFLLPAIIYYFHKRAVRFKLSRIGFGWVGLLFVAFFIMLFGIMVSAAVGLIGLLGVFVLGVTVGVFAVAIYGLRMIFDVGFRVKIVKHGQTFLYPN